MRNPELAGLLPRAGGRVEERRLVELVEAIARRQELWQPLVRHEAGRRHCESLHADDDIGIWVISWMPGDDTGFHDHAGSAGAVAVAAGQVREERPAWTGAGRCLEAATSETFTFDEEAVHRVVAVGSTPAVTIHAYSPPLTEMGAYEVDEHGTVARTTVRWDHVLAA